MFAIERPTLSQFGYADPDRHDTLHLLACQYLASPETIARLIPYFGLRQDAVPQHRQGFDESRLDLLNSLVSYNVSLDHEITVSPDDNTVIGLADVLLLASADQRLSRAGQRTYGPSSRRNEQASTDWDILADDDSHFSFSWAIEVKIAPVDFSDLLEQMRELRSRSFIHRWALATPYDLDPRDVDLLKFQDIRHLRLGKRFERYVALRRDADLAVSVDI
jgi:hypothetical protein